MKRARDNTPTPVIQYPKILFIVDDIKSEQGIMAYVFQPLLGDESGRLLTKLRNGDEEAENLGRIFINLLLSGVEENEGDFIWLSQVCLTDTRKNQIGWLYPISMRDVWQMGPVQIEYLSLGYNNSCDEPILNHPVNETKSVEQQPPQQELEHLQPSSPMPPPLSSPTHIRNDSNEEEEQQQQQPPQEERGESNEKARNDEEVPGLTIKEDEYGAHPLFVEETTPVVYTSTYDIPLPTRQQQYAKHSPHNQYAEIHMPRKNNRTNPQWRNDKDKPGMMCYRPIKKSPSRRSILKNNQYDSQHESRKEEYKERSNEIVERHYERMQIESFNNQIKRVGWADYL